MTAAIIALATPRPLGRTDRRTKYGNHTFKKGDAVPRWMWNTRPRWPFARKGTDAKVVFGCDCEFMEYPNGYDLRGLPGTGDYAISVEGGWNGWSLTMMLERPLHMYDGGFPMKWNITWSPASWRYRLSFWVLAFLFTPFVIRGGNGKA